MKARSHFRELRFRSGHRAGRRPPRGARFPALVGLAADVDEMLGNLSVMVVGLGSVGRRLALLLAQLGMAALWLTDHRRFKLLSLLTHALDPRDVGLPKASSSGRHCKRLSPRTRVHVFDGPLQHLDFLDFFGVDVVVLATDNPAAEAAASQVCRWLRKPLLQAAVHGETLTAQVRCVSNGAADGPCLACAFTSRDWALAGRTTRFPCDGSADPADAPPDVGAPTLSVNALCSLAADLAVLQLLKQVLRVGQPAEDTALEFSAYAPRTVLSPLRRNARCPCQHLHFRLVRAPRSLAHCTPAELARAAWPAGVPAGVSFSVAGQHWVEQSACRCAGLRAVARFLPNENGAAGRCPVCRARLVSLPLYSHDPVAATLLGAAAEQPLRRLGAGRARSVLVRCGDDAALVVEPNDWRIYERRSKQKQT